MRGINICIVFMLIMVNAVALFVYSKHEERRHYVRGYMDGLQLQVTKLEPEQAKNIPSHGPAKKEINENK